MPVTHRLFAPAVALLIALMALAAVPAHASDDPQGAQDQVQIAPAAGQLRASWSSSQFPYSAHSRAYPIS